MIAQIIGKILADLSAKSVKILVYNRKPKLISVIFIIKIHTICVKMCVKFTQSVWQILQKHLIKQSLKISLSNSIAHLIVIFLKIQNIQVSYWIKVELLGMLSNIDGTDCTNDAIHTTCKQDICTQGQD